MSSELQGQGNANVTLRLEEECDRRTVEELTREAFWNYFQPGADEHYLQHKLREHPDFIPELNFIAEIDGQIVGSIVYSKSTIENQATGGHWQVITFGPISVLPSFQGKGIGSRLVKHSAAVARELGYSAIVIYGDPRFYGRLGFRSGDRYDVTNSEHEFCVSLQVLPLQPGAMDGVSGVFEESSVFSSLESESIEAFDASFPAKVKESLTQSQLDFKMMCSLKYKVVA